MQGSVTIPIFRIHICTSGQVFLHSLNITTSHCIIYCPMLPTMFSEQVSNFGVFFFDS